MSKEKPIKKEEEKYPNQSTNFIALKKLLTAQVGETVELTTNLILDDAHRTNLNLPIETAIFLDPASCIIDKDTIYHSRLVFIENSTIPDLSFFRRLIEVITHTLLRLTKQDSPQREIYPMHVRPKAVEIFSNCFLVGEDIECVVKPFNLGRKSVIAKIRVKKTADFPLSLSDLSEDLTRLD